MAVGGCEGGESRRDIRDSGQTERRKDKRYLGRGMGIGRGHHEFGR